MRDYAELIEALRSCSQVNSLSLYKRDLMRKAADAIEALQAQIPQWISVEEALPNKPGRYLCIVKSRIWESELYTDFLGFDHGFFHDSGIADNVTHWMPLPEPPKGVDK